MTLRNRTLTPVFSFLFWLVLFSTYISVISAAWSKEAITKMLSDDKLSDATSWKNLIINKTINYVDIKGGGAGDDMIVVTYIESGTVYSPTLYMLMTKSYSDERHSYHMLVIPYENSAVNSYGGFAVDADSMSCFDIKSSFYYVYHGNSRVFTLIIAKRGQPFGESKIDIDVFQPKFDTLSGDVVLISVRHASVRSSTCSLSDLYELEQRVLNIHFEE